MNRNSKLFQELSRDELNAVMWSVFPDEPIKFAELLSGGLFNTTYRVKTAAHDVVLRMGPVNRELLLPFEENLMQAETEVDRLCLENGIPASKVLCCDTSRRVIDRDFMVVERIESVPLSDKSIPEAVIPALHEECGWLTRRLHEITGEKFGRLSEILRGNGKASWSEAVISEYHALFEKAAPHAVFTQALIDSALAFAEENRSLLDRITVPRLAHADLWAGNVLVQKSEDGGYHVCAIIDGDRAYFGDADYDLATPWLITANFLKGYGENETPFSPEELARKRCVTALLLELTDAYVWKVEYDSEDSFKSHIASAENMLK